MPGEGWQYHRMRTVYALLVGIDKYSEKPLRGCVNDVRAAEDWLLRQSNLFSKIQMLCDEQATKAAVTEGIASHLGRSGPGDTALLWFSGHGSRKESDDPRSANGRSEALVCYDSQQAGGQPLLQDTELGALLDGIAGRGAHVVAVLDCCHAGGATRESASGTRTRGVAWQPWWRTAGSRDGGGQGPEPHRHVLLAACRPQESAYEDVFDGWYRGCFSHALLGALHRLGPTTTYGKLHALAEEQVRSTRPSQHPELRGLHDQRFLRGDAAAGMSPFLLRFTASGWEVNCGSAHGLRAQGAEFTLLPEDGSSALRPPRAVVVREVRAESALVEPVGWRPGLREQETVYAVTPSALAFPPALVTLSGQRDGVRMLSEAIAGAPLLSTDGNGLPLHVEAAGGRARVTGGDGHPLDPLPLRSTTDAVRVADCLTHIVRWHHIRDFENPDARVSQVVRVIVEGPVVGDMHRTATGEVVCTYTGDLQEPQVKVSIHNGWDRPLWCVLLDLTDTYGCSPHLYDGDFISPGQSGMARQGEPVWLRLPPGRSVRQGAFVRDWLKVIVAENELNIAPFRLPAWSPDTSAARGGAVLRGEGGLLRLAPATASRDAGGPPQGAGLWGTASVVVRTRVP